MPYYPQSPIPPGRLRASGTNYLSLPGVNISSVGTVAQAANFVRYFPIKLETVMAFDQLVCEVTGAGAGGTTARMGIYHRDKDWVPGDLIVDGGTVAVDGTGVKTASISVILGPGRYYLCWNTDGTPTVRSVRGFPPNGHLLPTLGASPIVISLRGTQTYGAFPATGTVIDSVSGSTIPMDYWVFLRASTP